MLTMTTNGVTATASRVGRERELVMTRRVDAPLALVWSAWTEASHLPRWIPGPAAWTMSACEIDLREGGVWHLAWRRHDGREMHIRGVYQEVLPLERLVSNSSWGDAWPDCLETLTLTGEDGRTRITQAVRYDSEEAYDAAIGNGLEDGMAEALDSLEAYLNATKWKGMPC